MEELGKNIKLLRQEKGWSQNDFANRLGISVPAFSKIENGITDLHLSRLERIAEVLGMSLVEFITYQQQNKAAQSNDLLEAREKAVGYMTQVLSLQKQVIVL